MILGLTGSIGSGKSTVSSMLRESGALVVCADDIAREVVKRDTPALKEIVEHFGPRVLTPGGELDRPRLAELVFNDPASRLKLEGIIHPRVRAREEELIALHRNHPLLVLDIPLLYESGADQLCDAVVVVTVDDGERRRRLRDSRGMGDAEIDRRLAAQLPQDEKVRRAAHRIDNSGTLDATRTQVRDLVRRIAPGLDDLARS